MLEFVGKKGAIIAVDTLGTHKVKNLIKNEHQLFQIEFTISMFAQNYPVMSKSLITDLYKEKANHYTYEHLFELNLFLKNTTTRVNLYII